MIRGGNRTWRVGWSGRWTTPLRVGAGSSTYGKAKEASARCADSPSGQRNGRGTCTIGSGAVMEVRRRWTTWSCYTSTDTDSSTRKRVTDGPNRVLRGALGRLEPYEAEVSRTVLRGRGGSNASLLPDRFIAAFVEPNKAAINRRTPKEDAPPQSSKNSGRAAAPTPTIK